MRKDLSRVCHWLVLCPSVDSLSGSSTLPLPLDSSILLRWISFALSLRSSINGVPLFMKMLIDSRSAAGGLRITVTQPPAVSTSGCFLFRSKKSHPLPPSFRKNKKLFYFVDNNEISFSLVDNWSSFLFYLSDSVT